MFPQRPGALMAEPPDNTAEHEGAEAPELERQEGGEEGGNRQPIDHKQQELFDLAVGRSLDALSRDAQGLDAALKADPIKGAVAYGTSALRTVATAAQRAGSPIPFEILIQVGMQVIKELASVANDKGYLPDEQIGTFLKETLQQSIAKYAQLDMKDGKLSQAQMGQLQGSQSTGALAPQAAPQPGVA